VTGPKAHLPAEPQDSERVAVLAARYAEPVRRFFSRRVRDQAAVEDLTQEVFVRLLGRAGVGAIDNIEGYLFHTAANLLRERARRAAARIPEADAESFDPIEDLSPERILLGREAVALMVEALQELPERVRSVFVLNRFEELPAVEIARRLGVSLSTVEKDMMRAVAFIRKRVT
jgi:RNA polymerase sigma factor (sigma-70 family)